MYAEAGVVLPFLHGFSTIPHELELGLGAVAGHSQLLDEQLIASFNTCLSCDTPQMGNMVQATGVSGYDLGVEGDLFKAPEPIIEEPAVDPMEAAMSLISSGNNIVEETIKAVEIESIRNDNLLSEVYVCKNELLAKSAITDSTSELSDVKTFEVQNEHKEPATQNVRSIMEGPIHKSFSTGSLRSMDWMNGCIARPNFLEFHGVDFAAFGMKRVYSEGDIRTLMTNNSSLANTSIIRTSLEHQLRINDFKSEERRQMLSRYRKKRNKRNFGRKIKYACRKALAETQPRVRGRFAKIEGFEVTKPHYLL